MGAFNLALAIISLGILLSHLAGLIENVIARIILLVLAVAIAFFGAFGAFYEGASHPEWMDQQQQADEAESRQ